MTPMVTSLYAAPIGLLAIVLSNMASITRGRLKIALGDGGNLAMSVAMRRHGNLLENAPFAILLLALAEIAGLANPWVHGLGALLVVSRLLHPFGITIANPMGALRIVGTVGTHLTTTAASVFILWAALFA
jgi:uncharacterized protein